MSESYKLVENSYISPQCQYFVKRKKRLCRMTVKPDKHYCGEHEPQPKTVDGQDDTRIPCPNDPKHTCYASKLEKHLSICNARQQQQPHYIEHNINAPIAVDDCPRLPLTKTPLQRILQVIDKVNVLYDTYIKDKITTVPEQPIHSAVLQEFREPGRTESSLRHLRQASSLMHVMENEGLNQRNTAYVELGAGKGHLSYYAWWAWCQGSGSNSQVLLVDRASLRHKRDNKLKETRQNIDKELRAESNDSVHRIRADLAHLVLERVPAVQACSSVVGYAKHLCGVATDLALRCLCAAGVGERVRGAALASCCHHRCERAAYPAAATLQDLGIDAEDFNTLLGIVSWATCGDGRSRDRRNQHKNTSTHNADNPEQNNEPHDTDNHDSPETNKIENPNQSNVGSNKINDCKPDCDNHDQKNMKLHENDNPKPNELDNPDQDYTELHRDSEQRVTKINRINKNIQQIGNPNDITVTENFTEVPKQHNDEELGTKNLNLSQEQREAIGRRAKALLDWGRVLYLQERGFDARLVYYVPTSVSLENVCIVAKKRT